MTAFITQIINIHLNAHNILTKKQKGYREDMKGCKEQLIIDLAILR